MNSRCRFVAVGLLGGLAGYGDVHGQSGAATGEAMVAGARMVPVMVYDSARARVLVYGGLLATRQPGVDRLNPDPRTYAWDGRAWSVVAQIGPQSRDEVAFGYDALTGAIIAFGGRGETAQRDSLGRSVRIAFRETWRFADDRWTLLDTSGPQPRSSPQGAYDPLRRRLVVFGGALGHEGGRGTLATDTWEFDGREWKRFDVPGPPGRTGHVLAYDAHSKHIVLHGGVRSVDRLAFTDTWAWNGERWRLLSSEGPRAIFGAATTALDSGIVMFGGHTLQGATDALWHRNGAGWRSIASGGPAARTFNALATDTRNKRIYLFGGYPEGHNGQTEPPTDLWYFGNGKWVRVYSR